MGRLKLNDYGSEYGQVLAGCCECGIEYEQAISLNKSKRN